MKRIISLY